MIIDSGIAQRFSVELHGARAIAAIGVLGYHSLLTFKIDGIDDAHYIPFSLHAPGLFQWLLLPFNGQACVTLFFVLSGTVLAMSLQRDPPVSSRAIAAYWAKRLLRLYPLLVAAALLAAALLMIVPHPADDQATRWYSLQHQVGPRALPRELALNIIGARSSLNSAAWSIKVEILASLLFPAIFWISCRRGLAIGVMAAMAAFLFVPHNPAAFAYLSDFLLAFLLGSFLVAGGAPLLTRLAGLPPTVRSAVLAAGIVLLCVTRRVFNPADFMPSHVILFETIGAGLIVSVLLTRARKASGTAWAYRPLGDLSFGVYLLHVPILTAVTPLIAPIARAAGWLPAVCTLFAITLGATTALAWAMVRLVERPGIRLGTLLSMRIRNRTDISPPRRSALSG